MKPGRAGRHGACGALMLAAAWHAVAGAADAALPGSWAPMVDPGFCRIAPAAQAGDLAAARALYAANRPRDAAAQAAALAARAGTADDRLAAATLHARALKVIACDDEAMAVLDAALESAAPSPARCVAQSRRARLAATRDQADAERRAIAVLACAAPAGEDDAASEAHATLALVALGRSDYAQAGQHLERSLARAASPLARAEAWRLRGNLAQRRAPILDEARADHDASLQAAIDAADPEAQALARLERGHLDGAAGAGTAGDESRLAIAQAGLAQAEAGGLRRVLAYGSYLEGRALAQQRTGRTLARGARRLAQAATLGAAIGDTGQERAMRTELASALLLLGDDAGARAAALRARALALAAGLPREAAKADQTLGMLARLADPPDLDAAEAALGTALDSLRASGDDPADVARALGELATVAMARGQPGLATSRLEEALALAARSPRAIDAEVLRANQGWAAWHAGHAEEAQAAWRAAMRSAQPQPRALAWWGLARLALPEHPQLARARYAQAVAEVEAMRPAAGDVDPTARGAFDRRFSSLYREYAALLVDLGLYPQAHRAALLTQRQELVEAHWPGERSAGTPSAAPGAGPEPLDACPPALLLREQRLQALQSEQWQLRTPARHACCRDDGPQPLASASCPPDTELARYCALRHEVRLEQKAIKRQQDDCLAGLQAAVAAGRAEAPVPLGDDFADAWAKAIGDRPVYLVVTIAEEQRLRVLLRAPGDSGYRVATLAVPLARLQQLAGELAAGWLEAARLKRSAAPAAAREAALGEAASRLRDGPLRELHGLLLGRFDPLPDGCIVAFALDRVLRGLPVAALHDGRGYLGARVATVRLTPSAAADAAVGPIPQGASLVMGVSKPDLPHVEAEVAAVARALQTRAFLNEQSTRRRVVDWLEELRPGRRALALHLASHATLGGTKASAEVHLWGQDPLTGLDLDDLRASLARVRLVVFSACRSAADGGELALGLAGLAERGARSVVGSLWNVDDVSTARLMTAFYDAWRRDPDAGVAQALALAQRQLLAGGEHAHPYFWAPFGVVGRWD